MTASPLPAASSSLHPWNPRVIALHPWNPHVIAWLSLVLSPAWGGVMAGINERRIGGGRPAWHPIVLGILMTLWGVFGLLAGGFVLHGVIYVVASGLLWCFSLRSQAKRLAQRGPVNTASWRVPLIAGSPTGLICLFLIVLLPILLIVFSDTATGLTPQQACEAFVAAKTPDDAAKYLSSRAQPLAQFMWADIHAATFTFESRPNGGIGWYVVSDNVACRGDFLFARSADSTLIDDMVLTSANGQGLPTPMSMVDYCSKLTGLQSSLVAGQVLTRTPQLFGGFDLLHGIGLALLVGTLITVWVLVVHSAHSGVSGISYSGGIAGSAIIGILCVYALTFTGTWFFGTVLSFGIGPVNNAVAQAAGVAPSDDSVSQTSGTTSRFWLNAGRAAAHMRLKGKAAGVAAIIAIVVVLLLAIGAGYAFTAIDLPFWGHSLAYIAGVGLPEELAKAIAGVVLCNIVCRARPANGQLIAGDRKTLTICMLVAGLGFGAGESLKYFSEYSAGGLGLDAFVLRATWCVVLHSSWCVLAGVLLDLANKSVKASEGAGALLIPFIMAVIPSAVLHGIYDASLLHVPNLGWIVGGASILMAARILASMDEVASAEHGNDGASQMTVETAA